MTIGYLPTTNFNSGHPTGFVNFMKQVFFINSFKKWWPTRMRVIFCSRTKILQTSKRSARQKLDTNRSFQSSYFNEYCLWV